MTYGLRVLKVVIDVSGPLNPLGGGFHPRHYNVLQGIFTLLALRGGALLPPQVYKTPSIHLKKPYSLWPNPHILSTPVA